MPVRSPSRVKVGVGSGGKHMNVSDVYPFTPTGCVSTLVPLTTDGALERYKLLGVCAAVDT